MRDAERGRGVDLDRHRPGPAADDARPQGRGKIERFFGTLGTELLPQLPSQLVRGHPTPTARLTLAEADAAIGAWISGTYHQRPHSETGKAPHRAWLGEGSPPRTTDQPYRRIGFAHQYRPLGADELAFVLTRHWRKLGLSLDREDFTDVARITRGNFRLVHRLFVQIERVLKINDLSLGTSDIVEAARSTLVIGDT